MNYYEFRNERDTCVFERVIRVFKSTIFNTEVDLMELTQLMLKFLLLYLKFCNGNQTNEDL